MTVTAPTFIGQVAAVASGVVRVRLRDNMASTLIMLGGESYRVGQIGAFVRIPLGYTSLYAICTQVGADAAPPSALPVVRAVSLDAQAADHLTGYRWMTVVLFGESLGGQFERGVGEYPTVGDEVHLVTTNDLKVIYGAGARTTGATLPVGGIAAAAGIPAEIDVAALVSRHSAIVGSTGSGKSNLVAVLLESLCSGQFPNARVVLIDPHGEYSSAVGDKARVFCVTPNRGRGEKHLEVPFWALPFSELQQFVFGGLQPNHEAAIREHVLDMKRDAIQYLEVQPRREYLTADSPVPFSLKKLWYELDRFEKVTFKTAQGQKPGEEYAVIDEGDPSALRAVSFPAASPYNQAPYKNQKKRNIERHLDLMASRLRDARYSFLLTPGHGLEPDLDGRVGVDLDEVVSSWIGHDRPVTIFDVSDVPSEIQPTIVGTMLRIIYDMLFWAQNLPVGGRQQPLLIMIDEAHRFVPEGRETSAHRTLWRIAKEGRKYGAGLMLVSQRPSELDGAILSQAGSLIALRLANSSDRGKVAAAVPDELGGLVALLPALRTGEGIFVGDIMPVPTRVRVRKAAKKPVGDDPQLPEVWQTARRALTSEYRIALGNWRRQSVANSGEA